MFDLRYVALPLAMQIARGKATLVVFTLMSRFASPEYLRNKWPDQKNFLACTTTPTIAFGKAQPGQTRGITTSQSRMGLTLMGIHRICLKAAPPLQSPTVPAKIAHYRQHKKLDNKSVAKLRNS
jgi:hypothetical protein